MKPVPIPMKQWLAANERTRVLPGDQWYLNFSASILSLVKQSPLFKEDDYAQKDATVSLTMYFQDYTTNSIIPTFPSIRYPTATSPMKSIRKI